MRFQRKLLPGRIVVDNSRYRGAYDRTLAACAKMSFFELRSALSQLDRWKHTTDGSSAFEAIVTTLIELRDVPQLKDSTGRVWA